MDNEHLYIILNCMQPWHVYYTRIGQERKYIMQRNHIHSRAYGQARTAAKNAGFDEETCKAKGREAGKKAVREWLNGVDID